MDFMIHKITPFKLLRYFVRKFGYSLEKDMGRPHHLFLQEYFGAKELIGAEVGVFRGENSVALLEKLNLKKLYAIDPWRNYQGYTKDLTEAKTQTLKRLKDYKQVQIIDTFSDQAAKLIPDNSLDFVYIDGNHTYEYAKPDIEIHYEKVKSCGVIAGHDFDWPGVTQAVFEFCFENNYIPTVKRRGNDWWIIKN